MKKGGILNKSFPLAEEIKLSLDDDSDRSLFNKIRYALRKKSHLHKGSNLTEEIHDLMNEGQAKGLITDEESDMVSGVLDLKETTAHSIMIPRTEISSASADATLNEFIQLVAECGHTRIPVYQDNIDKIVGLLHAKDLLRLFGSPLHSKIPEDLRRKPYFVPGSQRVSELLRDLRSRKTHMAIVTDEYGGTAGIITIEDILEEIVGEIMDEHDHEQSLLSVIDNESILVDGRLEIKKLESHFNIKLPEGEFESVGGFIIHLLGRIPDVDERIDNEDLTMTIKSADERRINEILITYKAPSQPLIDIDEQH